MPRRAGKLGVIGQQRQREALSKHHIHGVVRREVVPQLEHAGLSSRSLRRSRPGRVHIGLHPIPGYAPSIPTCQPNCAATAVKLPPLIGTSSTYSARTQTLIASIRAYEQGRVDRAQEGRPVGGYRTERAGRRRFLAVDRARGDACTSCADSRVRRWRHGVDRASAAPAACQ